MANIFGRYVWLVEQFRQYGKLTYKDINLHWQESGLSYGKGDTLPLRTFHNHCNAIYDIFEVHIVCDTKDGYKYYIDNIDELESDNLRLWLIDSYVAMNQIQADRKLKGRILYENIPSGRKWLNVITDAMRNNQVLCITHQGFGKSESRSFEIEPYYLKVSRRRWYVLARNPEYSKRNILQNEKEGGNLQEDVYMIYALDRILDCQPTEKTFQMKEDFDIGEYFNGCFGVIRSEEKPQKILLKAYNNTSDYLRTLPLHESQKELDIKDNNDNKAAYFELHVCPTYDFYQTLLAHADQIEVIEPKEVREKMYGFAKKLMAHYDKE